MQHAGVEVDVRASVRVLLISRDVDAVGADENVGGQVGSPFEVRPRVLEPHHVRVREDRRDVELEEVLDELGLDRPHLFEGLVPGGDERLAPVFQDGVSLEEHGRHPSLFAPLVHVLVQRTHEQRREPELVRGLHPVLHKVSHARGAERHEELLAGSHVRQLGRLVLQPSLELLVYDVLVHRLDLLAPHVPHPLRVVRFGRVHLLQVGHRAVDDGRREHLEPILAPILDFLD